MVWVLIITVLAAFALVGILIYDHKHPQQYDDYDDYDPECCGGGVQEEWR